MDVRDLRVDYVIHVMQVDPIDLLEMCDLLDDIDTDILHCEIGVKFCDLILKEEE
tara:strand:- start:546 stop:710 length:165 start_codon:yes stop_codon:yes gene_type:complete